MGLADKALFGAREEATKKLSHCLPTSLGQNRELVVCWNVGAEGRWLCDGCAWEKVMRAFCAGRREVEMAWGMGEDGDEAMNSMCCVSVYLCPCRVGTQI